MTIKAHPLVPDAAEAAGQGVLFEQSSFSPWLEMPVDPVTEQPAPSGVKVAPNEGGVVIGPTVNLVERAEHLKTVTEKLAQINGTRGLAEVLETSQGRRVHERYGGDAHEILHKAEAIHDRRMHDAKTAFAHASGMWAMIESGLMKKEDAKVATHESWVEFMRKYADANQPNRVQLRRQQAKLVKTLTKPPKK